MGDWRSNAGGAPGRPHNPKPPPAVVMAAFDDLPAEARAAVRECRIDLDPRTVKTSIDRRGLKPTLQAIANSR